MVPSFKQLECFGRFFTSIEYIVSTPKRISRSSEKIKITRSRVRALPHFKPDPKKSKTNQQLIFDSVLPGFGIRITEKSKSYFAQKRVGRKVVRFTIGPCDQIIPEKAREIANEKLLEMTKGLDPNLVKQGKLADAEITLEKCFQGFVEVRSLKPTTFREYNRAMKSTFKDWRKKPLVSISKDMVARRFQKVSTKSGPALANLEFRFLRALMNFAVGQYENSKGGPLVIINPVNRLSETKAWHRIKRRQSIISKTDLPRWFEAVGELENKNFRDYLTLLFLTGLRRSEGFKLQWSDIDMKSKTFIIQDTKNHNPLSLPMGDFLFKMFEQRKEFSKSEWVFPGSGKMGHLVEPKGALKEIHEKTGIRFSFHDLRRLFITTAESLDISTYAMKALVNHSLNGDVPGGYIVSDPERLRTPMQRTEDHLIKLCRTG